MTNKTEYSEKNSVKLLKDINGGLGSHKKGAILNGLTRNTAKMLVDTKQGTLESATLPDPEPAPVVAAKKK